MKRVQNVILFSKPAKTLVCSILMEMLIWPAMQAVMKVACCLVRSDLVVTKRKYMFERVVYLRIVSISKQMSENQATFNNIATDNMSCKHMKTRLFSDIFQCQISCV